MITEISTGALFSRLAREDSQRASLRSNSWLRELEHAGISPHKNKAHPSGQSLEDGDGGGQGANGAAVEELVDAGPLMSLANLKEEGQDAAVSRPLSSPIISRPIKPEETESHDLNRRGLRVNLVMNETSTENSLVLPVTIDEIGLRESTSLDFLCPGSATAKGSTAVYSKISPLADLAKRNMHLFFGPDGVAVSIRDAELGAHCQSAVVREVSDALTRSGLRVNTFVLNGNPLVVTGKFHIGRNGGMRDSRQGDAEATSIGIFNNKSMKESQ